MAGPEKTEVVDDQTEGQADVQVEDGTEVKDEGEAKVADEQKTVPYERLQEVTAQLKSANEQNELLQQQMALRKANPPQAQAQQPPFDIFKEVGATDDDDVLTVSQQKKIMEHQAKVYDARLADIAFHQQHPDFAEFVGTADEIAAGMYAKPLSTAIKENPALIHTIASSGNPRLAAYNIAKLQMKKTTGEAITKTEAKNAIDEAVENAARVKSVSNVKGGGALSEAGRYEIMPDKDFLALTHEHGAIV